MTTIDADALRPGLSGLKPDQQSVAAWAALGRVLLTANAFLFVD